MASMSPPKVNSPTRPSRNFIALLFFLVGMRVNLDNFYDLYFRSFNDVNGAPLLVQVNSSLTGVVAFERVIPCPDGAPVDHNIVLLLGVLVNSSGTKTPWPDRPLRRPLSSSTL